MGSNIDLDSLLQSLENPTTENSSSLLEDLGDISINEDEQSAAINELLNIIDNDKETDGSKIFSTPEKEDEYDDEIKEEKKNKRINELKEKCTTGRPEMLQDAQRTIRKKTKAGQTVTIDNYQLGEQLGKGAFGVVHKGLDLRNGKFVAIKRLNRSKLDGSAMMKEIELLKSCNHPNIVQYFGLVTTKEHLNLILEFVDSGSLAQVLSRYGYFPESLAAIYTAQLLNGLEYLHSMNIIHRDIKGGNLLITKEGTVKLADFGIAITTTNDAGNRMSVIAEGSPYWMAPEAIEMGNPTPASDIWSVGCTLIELLTGYPPYFDMVTISAVYRMVQDDHPPLPDSISAELEDFLLCCFKRGTDADGNIQRPSATQLKQHPWILKNTQQVENSNVTYRKMTSTIKRHTIKLESAAIQTQLANMKLYDQLEEEDDEDSSSESSSLTTSTTSSTSSLPSSTSSSSTSSTSSPSTPTKSSSQNVALSSHEKKGTIGRRRKKKRKKKKKKKNSDLSRMVIIVSTEARRSIFAFTMYLIKVTWDDREWTSERTWSDFKDLNSRLTRAFPQQKLPPCPPRKYFGVMDPDFVTRRWRELQGYLEQLLEISAIDSMLESFLLEGKVASS